MTAGQTVNLCGSVAALAGCLVFVAVYTAAAPWWRSRVGRLLVTKALVIAGFMVVSVTAYVMDPGGGTRVGPLLLARGILAGGFGLMMICQAWLVGRVQTEGSRHAGTYRTEGGRAMSAEARTLQLIEDAVRRAAAPLEDAVKALSARLAAVEESGGRSVAAPPKRAAGGRTVKSADDAAPSVGEAGR